MTVGEALEDANSQTCFFRELCGAINCGDDGCLGAYIKDEELNMDAHEYRSMLYKKQLAYEAREDAKLKKQLEIKQKKDAIANKRRSTKNANYHENHLISNYRKRNKILEQAITHIQSINDVNSLFARNCVVSPRNEQALKLAQDELYNNKQEIKRLEQVKKERQR